MTTVADLQERYRIANERIAQTRNDPDAWDIMREEGWYILGELLKLARPPLLIGKQTPDGSVVPVPIEVTDMRPGALNYIKD